MTHTNFKILIPGQTRRELSEALEQVDTKPTKSPEAAAPAPPLAAVPQQRTGDHDYFDAYATVHALMVELAAARE